MPVRFEFEVKEKGRAVLPVGLRTACGFEVGTRLVARPIGPGQAIVETTDAVLDRIWSGIPSGTQVDAVAELATARAGEVALREQRATANAAGDERSDERSVALLTALGLE
ncbi:MAG: hypothetical protein M3355_04245 [Actinomycetota bacterium]|nr:hypothetical protein [Actinomycetota bacterium]